MVAAYSSGCKNSWMSVALSALLSTLTITVARYAVSIEIALPPIASTTRIQQLQVVALAYNGINPRMFAPWLVSSIIVKVTSKKDWEYGAINQPEQVFQLGNRSRQAVQMLNGQDFTVQLFASLIPHKDAEPAHEIRHLAAAKDTSAPLRGELLDPGTSTVKERPRQKSSWNVGYTQKTLSTIASAHDEENANCFLMCPLRSECSSASGCSEPLKWHMGRVDEKSSRPGPDAAYLRGT